MLTKTLPSKVEKPLKGSSLLKEIERMERRAQKEQGSLERVTHLAVRSNYYGSRSACGRDTERLLVPNHLGKTVTVYEPAKRTYSRGKVTCADCKKEMEKD